MSWPPIDAEHIIVTTSEMIKLEEKILEAGMPVAALMEKVGNNIAQWLLKKPFLLRNGALVLVGPGHNGGDGLVVARELHLSGIKVKIWCPLPITKTLTVQHLSYAQSLGIENLKIDPNPFINELWIDALFGIGQSKPLPKSIVKLLNSREELRPGKLISIDIPSGICSDSGKYLSPNSKFKSSYTLAVGLKKRGLVQDQALTKIGSVKNIDFGIANNFLEDCYENQLLRITYKDISSAPFPQPNKSAMKYQRGRVLIIAGSKTYPGAALLSIKGALASGAGSIKAALPKSIADNLWKVAPEVVLSGLLGNSSNNSSSISEYLLHQNLSIFDSILIGPGLGINNEKWKIIEQKLESFEGLLVLDADGLNRLAFSQDGLKLLTKRRGPTWITPHKAEFERLFPDLATLNPIDQAIEAAKISKASVLLKGANSVISDPNGNSWQLGETAPWVARTGLGDVLSGYVTGFGSICMASTKEAKTEFLASAALIHSEAAKRTSNGSSASLISENLSHMTKCLQKEKC